MSFESAAEVASMTGTWDREGSEVHAGVHGSGLAADIYDLHFAAEERTSAYLTRRSRVS
jgi:hypothetical protein